MFEFEGEKYRIIGVSEGKGDTCNWQVKETDKFRERDIFAWRPWWVGKKFRWLKKIKIKEQLEIVRYSGFDDGWSYRHYWKPWNKRWEAIEIL